MSKLMLKNVRLSFPSLFKRSTFNGEEGKFEATFLLPKTDTKTVDKINDLIDNALKEAKVKVPQDKRFIKDGDDIDYDGYAGHWAIKASSNSRPMIIDRDKSILAEDDEKPYAGCYVNAQISVWVMNNQYGKRVLANLSGVQFVKDGEPFGSNNAASIDDFDEIEDDF